MSIRTSSLISLAVHAVLIPLLSILVHPVQTYAQEEIIPVHLVTINEPQPRMPAVKLTTIKPGAARGPSRQVSKAPMGGTDRHAPRPKQAPAPPRVLTAKGGQTKVPAGRIGGTGVRGTGAQPAGPTYGPGVAPGGPLPVYPKNALDQNLEGTVTLSVEVSASGKVTKVRVARSSGHALLDDAARRSVAAWTFTPGMKSGKPAPGVVTISIRFAGNAVERL